MEHIQVDKSAIHAIFDILDLQNPKCTFCGDGITSENFGILAKDYISCKSIICLAQSIDKEEEIDKEKKFDNIFAEYIRGDTGYYRLAREIAWDFWNRGENMAKCENCGISIVVGKNCEDCARGNNKNNIINLQCKFCNKEFPDTEFGEHLIKEHLPQVIE